MCNPGFSALLTLKTRILLAMNGNISLQIQTVKMAMPIRTELIPNC